MPAAKKKRQRLFLIDGYSNIFRAFYAIRNLTNSKGFPTNAVYGFVNMLRKLLREQQPDLVGVAFDVSDATVLRRETYEDYKANRRPMPEDLVPQIPWVRKAIEAHRIPVVQMEGYEADDILGTLSAKAAEAGYDVVLVSADKDLMQLVGPHVSVLHTGRDKLYGPAEVEEDFGVPPGKIVDVLSLKGDSVDNVPGVAGIGDKGAVQLITEFGSLDELLERADEVKRKSYREGLEKHRDDALMSKELVTIHTDLDVEFEPARLKLEEGDPDALRELFREMEFSSFLEELEASAPGGAEIAPARELETVEAWAEAAAAAGTEVRVAVLGDPPIGLAVGEGDEDSGESAFYVDFRRAGLQSAALESVASWAADEGRTLIGHDLKEVLRAVPDVASGRIAVRASLVDTMLVAYVLRPELRGHTLADVALDRLGVQPIPEKEVGWGKGKEPATGGEALASYAAERVALPKRLATRMLPELDASGEAASDLGRIYRDIEEPLLPVLLRMEERGIGLDRGFLAAMSDELGGEIGKLEAAIYGLAGDEFNLNSPAQLGEVMFERLGYPVVKKTKKTKSFSTDAETLQQLADQGYEMAEHVLRYRELSKLKSTYVDALPLLVADDGRVHTRFAQAVAATGRLSSNNPNLQNIPVRTEIGQRIRKAFVAAEGRHLLVADYSQIELRILAHIAREEALIESFRAGEDVHRATAAAVLGVAPDLVTPDQRRAAKTINFGIIYGMSPYGLSQTLKISTAEAKKFIDAYFERYPGVQRYMDETLASAEEEGHVATLYGRVRHLPEIRSRNRVVRENAKRMAINARIQGTAADLLKVAMIRVDRRLERDHPEAGLLLTVHDELVLEVPEGEIDSVAETVRTEMEGVEELDVPLVVDVGSGRTWYDAKD